MENKKKGRKKGNGKNNYELYYKDNFYKCRNHNELSEITGVSPQCISRIINKHLTYKRKYNLKEIKINVIPKNLSDDKL